MKKAFLFSFLTRRVKLFLSGRIKERSFIAILDNKALFIALPDKMVKALFISLLD